MLAPVSADGRRLFYTQRHEWSNLAITSFDAWRRHLAPRALTTGSANYESARLSPDGRQLAVVRSESEAWSLQIIPTEGGTPREVGRLPVNVGLSWSHDGQRLLLATNDPDSGMGLRMFSLRDEPTRTYFYGLVGDTPEWLGDSAIVVPRLGNRSLQVVEPATGRRFPLPGVDTTGWMLWPRASPDGKRIAFVWNAGSGRQGVYVLRRSDSSLTTLTNSLMNPTGWSRDGGTVFLVGSRFLADTDRVLAVPATGGRGTLLGAFPSDMEVLDVTPDGQSAVLNWHQGRSDVWVIQLPKDLGR